MIFKCFVLEDLKPPSENFLYKPAFSGKRTRNGMFTRGHSYLYKHPDVKHYQELIKMKLGLNFQEFPNFNQITSIIAGFKFYISKERFGTSDTSNMVKATEDAWVEAMKVGMEKYDDSFHVSVISDKYIVPEGRNEFLIIQLGLVTEEDLEDGKDRDDLKIELINKGRSRNL